jgi:hypothetical protein
MESAILESGYGKRDTGIPLWEEQYQYPAIESAILVSRYGKRNTTILLLEAQY